MMNLTPKTNLDLTDVSELLPTDCRQYRNPTYSIVSLMGYLIGVEECHMQRQTGENGQAAAVYQKLKNNRNARIIRDLCIVRNGIERNYGRIREAFGKDFKNIGSVPDLIPSDSVQRLIDDNIKLYMNRPDVDEYLIRVNREIANRINNVKDVFPTWLKWEYLRKLFVMPNGQKPEGIKAAGAEFNADRNRYPYRCYINWAGGNVGNLLYNDERFVTELYISEEDCFEDLSLVRDASTNVYNDIYNFIASSSRTLLIVDCENSDPIKLAACLSGIASYNMPKIHKIMLVDSDFTSSGWGILSQTAQVPIEHVKTERLLEHKSQVDMSLAVRTCQEVYSNGVDSVVLVSSDSDYWALIKNLADIDFFVLAEREKCSSTFQTTLDDSSIHYCFIDDFCRNASYSVKTATICDHIQKVLDDAVRLNADELLNDAVKASHLTMTAGEREEFCKRFLKTMRIGIDADGTIRLKIDANV